MTALTKSRFPGDVTIGGRHIFTALVPVPFVLLPTPESTCWAARLGSGPRRRRRSRLGRDSLKAKGPERAPAIRNQSQPRNPQIHVRVTGPGGPAETLQQSKRTILRIRLRLPTP